MGIPSLTNLDVFIHVIRDYLYFNPCIGGVKEIMNGGKL